MGRTMKESLQKAMRSLEIGSAGFESRAEASAEALRERLAVPNADRLWCIGEAFRRGMTVEDVAAYTRVDPWFLRHIAELIATEGTLGGRTLASLGPEDFWRLKQDGFSDLRLAALLKANEADVRARREGLGVRPVYKTVDTCGAEFEAYTPYLYSTYERGDDEAAPTTRRKIVILGGGPNRIGQGIEFDYCCVHSAAGHGHRHDGLPGNADQAIDSRASWFVRVRHRGAVRQFSVHPRTPASHPRQQAQGRSHPDRWSG
jgi:carbamoyl-phosphate synthase large subunit